MALGGEGDVVEDAEPREDRGDLEGVGDAEPDAGVGGQAGDVAAVEADRAGVGQQAAGEQADEGGLAGAVRADQGVDLAGREVEVDGVDGVQRRRSGGVRPRASSRVTAAMAARGRAGRRAGRCGAKRTRASRARPTTSRWLVVALEPRSTR